MGVLKGYPIIYLANMKRVSHLNYETPLLLYADDNTGLFHHIGLINCGLFQITGLIPVCLASCAGLIAVYFTS